MAEAVVTSALAGLCDLLIQEGKLLSGVKGQVKQLQTELKLMQSFLKDADKKHDEDETVRVWISEIREAAYDAEAVIQTYAVKVASRRRGGIKNAFKRYACIIHDAAELHKIGLEIEAINTKISTLRTSLQTYGITPLSEGSSSAPRTNLHLRRSYSHVVEENIVGLDEDKKILVAQLVNVCEEYKCGVVSIWGMGGLGKTTLAKKVYHHNDVRRHFGRVAWASISQQCQTRDVWEGILFKLLSLGKNERVEIKGLRDEEVAKKLHQVQIEQKCLVILDDIWTTDAWDSLSPAFPVGKVGSKLLLTTRIKEVAQHVDDGRGFLHESRFLNEEESWELLEKKAFRGKPDPDFRTKTGMENLGRKMVRRCGGLPLAIVVLGGVLATKHTLSEWITVHENINSLLRNGKGHNQQYSSVYKVLALSYLELPYQLKPCFLYLCCFPEDYDIPTKKIVRIWIAEGIVPSMQHNVEEEESLEDVAERYLGELMDRSMVQVGERGSTRRVKTCRLHDLMRDIGLSKANEENFLRVLRPQDRNKQIDSRPVHRLALNLDNGSFENFPEHEKTLYLRSLLIVGMPLVYSSKTRGIEQSWFVDFKLLKILDLEKYKFVKKKEKEKYKLKGNLASTIGDLIHLRYLSISYGHDTNIPSSIGNLRCLQTLILISVWTSTRVPNVIWKLKKLRHLYLPYGMLKIGGKLQLGNLRDLQTLQHFDSRRCEVNELIKLINLKKLGITHFSGSLKELEGILISPNVALSHLCSLNIRLECPPEEEETISQRIISSHPHLYKLNLIARIGKLPEYQHFPPNLTKLILQNSRLQEDPMPILENLPNLVILKLYSDSFLGKQIVCSSNGFPQLKTLLLKDLKSLEEWHVGEEAMPNLCDLTIVSCKELRIIPDGLRFITTLRKLEIRDMPLEFENRLRVVNGAGGEDLYKVPHVPSIIFKAWHAV